MVAPRNIGIARRLRRLPAGREPGRGQEDAMISRELVRHSLEFASPPSVPRQAWVLPWAEEHYPEDVARLRAEFPDDIVTAPGLYLTPVSYTHLTLPTIYSV